MPKWLPLGSVRGKGRQRWSAEVAKLGQSGKKAGADIAGSFKGDLFKSAGDAVSSMLSPMALVGKASAIIKDQWNAILAVQREAASVQVGLAGSQAKALDTLGPGSDLSKADLTSLVEQGARSVSLGEAYAAVSTALKEAGTDFSSPRQSIRRWPLANWRRRAWTQSARNEIAGAAVSLRKLNPSLSAQQAAAQVIATSRGSESSIGQVAKDLFPAVGRLGQFAAGTSTGDLSAAVLAIEGTQDKGIGSAADATEKLFANLHKAGVTGSLDEQIGKARSDAGLRAKLLSGIKDPGACLASRECLPMAAIPPNGLTPSARKWAARLPTY